MEKWEALVYFGHGKDHRRITLPLRGAGGTESVDGLGLMEIYRIRLYLRRPPPSAVTLMLKDVPAFCRLAIAERLPEFARPACSSKERATAPGF